VIGSIWNALQRPAGKVNLLRRNTGAKCAFRSVAI
jgi:hypothetical protein